MSTSPETPESKLSAGGTLDNAVKQTTENFSQELRRNDTLGIPPADLQPAQQTARVENGQMIVPPLVCDGAAQPKAGADAPPNNQLQTDTATLAGSSDSHIARLGQTLQHPGVHPDADTVGDARFLADRVNKGFPITYAMDKIADQDAQRLEPGSSDQLQKDAATLAGSPDSHLAKLGHTLQHTGVNPDANAVGDARFLADRLNEGLPITPIMDKLADQDTQRLEQAATGDITKHQ